MLQKLFFIVSGAFDMDQASFGGQEVVAYKAINALLERSAQINRDRQRNYDKLLRFRGRAYLSLMQNWYTEDRFIPYERDGKMQAIKIKGEDLIVPAKLMVVSGSTLPVSQAQRREEVILLFDKGLIDDQECLKGLDYPDYMNVLNRKRQGAYGELWKRFGIVDVPEPILMYFEQIASMDQKEFDALSKQGKLPPFTLLLQQLLQGGQQPEDPMKAIEMQKAQGEAMELQAKAQKAISEAKKVDAEIQLVVEKAKSEAFGRMIQAEGVKLDYKKLEQEAAKLVNDFEIGRKQIEQKGTESFMKKSEQGPYREKGLVSNNKGPEA
jgi:hypothetical protein